jgi:hypothetical protein
LKLRVVCRTCKTKAIHRNLLLWIHGFWTCSSKTNPPVACPYLTCTGARLVINVSYHTIMDDGSLIPVPVYTQGFQQSRNPPNTYWYLIPTRHTTREKLSFWQI